MKRFLSLLLPFFLAFSPVAAMDSTKAAAPKAISATIDLRKIFGYSAFAKELYLSKNLGCPP